MLTHPLKLTLCLTLFLTACQQDQGGRSTLVQGESVSMNGTTVSTWASLDENGQVMRTGLRIPFTAIQKAPTSGPPLARQIDFPSEVQQSTFLQHIGLDWNPAGHEPEGRYTTPHFDIHFHGISKAESSAIDCSDTTQINPADVPDGWFPPVPPGAPPQQFCVPTMGYHSLPATEFTESGELKAGLFDQVMIVGSYGGKFIFLEPMITQKLLLEKQNFAMPVPMPKNLGRTTRYPTRFQATYNSVDNSYHFILSGFQQVQ